jgi:hypothetical protein
MADQEQRTASIFDINLRAATLALVCAVMFAAANRDVRTNDD